MNIGLAKKTGMMIASRNLIVRLEGSSQEPATPVERLAIAMLRREGRMPFHLLVQGVAGELYQQALHEGGWILDLGVFGRTLFVPSVANEIKAGNGTLWQIEKQT